VSAIQDEMEKLWLDGSSVMHIGDMLGRAVSYKSLQLEAYYSIDKHGEWSHNYRHASHHDPNPNPNPNPN